MSTVAFSLICAVTLAAATGAMVLRNVIHSVLLLIGSWAGLAVFYLWAGAEFIAFAQVLVYVGAVSMVVLFAVLLTGRGPDNAPSSLPGRARGAYAILCAAALFAVLAAVILRHPVPAQLPAAPTSGVKQLGTVLLGIHAASLVVTGMILTVATLGGVVIAAEGRGQSRQP